MCACTCMYIFALFHHLLTLNKDLCLLFAYGNDFLLIQTYQANCMQNLESINTLINKNSPCIYKSTAILVIVVFSA